MRQSLLNIRSQAYLIIVVAFVLGAVTGSLLMNLVAAYTPISPKPTMTQELTKELNLTPAQQRAVEAIFIESRRQTKEVYKTIQPQVDEIRAQTKNRIKAILDTNQQDRYEDWATKKDAERKGEKK
jgi:Spy/CpxP family protein refolding chaperone